MSARAEAFRRWLVGVENWGRIATLVFRGILGMRFVAAVFLLLGVGYWLTTLEELSPRSIHNLLTWIFALVALLLASPLLPDERSSGTLEILWLACGSMRRLLRWKLAALTAGFTIFAAPALGLVSWYIGWELNLWMEAIYLLTLCLLISAWTFYVGSYIPQAWAGGLVAGVILFSLLWPLSRLGGTLNPFLNIYTPTQDTLAIGRFVFNRIWVLALAWFFHDQTARRARLWFK